MTQSEPDNISIGDDDCNSLGITNDNKVFLESLDGIRRFSYEAMATTFEIIVQHDEARYAEQAACAAFEELVRLEGELSKFTENSDISRINNLAAGQIVLKPHLIDFVT